ncbi:hypothetical protein HMPREF1584_00268 [Gardnerella vaginalis JCP8481A]|nr:hypothetical protein HMPREF1584_00268 [Gardnerella vaginalis JCP8481A]EPI44626.1 hypothetical protein HMPREF1585_00058 [Gardnerella vaginalis JCP8481B]
MQTPRACWRVAMLLIYKPIPIMRATHKMRSAHYIDYATATILQNE